MTRLASFDRIRRTAVAAGVAILCAALTGAAPAAGPQRARAASSFTLSPNRPYASDAGKLHFHNPTTVETGGTASFENRAAFGALTRSQNSRYLRLAVKTAAGETYAISCAVKSSGTGNFEVVGPNLALTPPLTTTTISFVHKAQLAQWEWFTIAATAPWTFHQCTVSKGKP